MATANTTSTSNDSWFNGFLDTLNVGKDTYLGYLQVQSQAQANKLQAQNNFWLGQQQISANDAMNARANMLLWGLVIGGVVIVALLFKRRR